MSAHRVNLVHPNIQTVIPKEGDVVFTDIETSELEPSPPSYVLLGGFAATRGPRCWRTHLDKVALRGRHQSGRGPWG